MTRPLGTLRRVRRRLVAGVLLLGVTASSFEAVAGLLRDGSVHHETVAQALAHPSQRTGEHGHETASEAPDQDHGPDHQHGTGADHCVHAHSAALLSPKAVALADGEVGMPPIASLAIPSDHRAPPLFHPPRA